MQVLAQQVVYPLFAGLLQRWVVEERAIADKAMNILKRHYGSWAHQTT